eukprot:g78856.t1
MLVLGMKITIFGAGAIGGLIGAALQRHGEHEVSLVARGQHLKAIRERGLLIQRKDGSGYTVHFPAGRLTDRAASLGPQDVVVVAVKAHQAWEATEEIRSLCGPETMILTAMNGLPWWYNYSSPASRSGGTKQQEGQGWLGTVDPQGRQWRLLGPGRCIGCVVWPAAEITKAGVITHMYGDKFTLGEPDGSRSTRVLRLAAALMAAGFKAPVRKEIREDIWKKLIGNATFNPISVLTGVTLDQLTEPDTAIRRVCEAVMKEVMSVAEATGVRFRITLQQRMEGARGVGKHKTSMLQDLEAGKALELDALVTAVQELAAKHGVPTPALDTVLALTQVRAAKTGCYSFSSSSSPRLAHTSSVSHPSGPSLHDSSARSSKL